MAGRKLALCIILSGGCLLELGCRDQRATSPTQPGLATDELAAIRPAVTEFCGNCHSMPSADSFPQDAWYTEVEQGYRFYLESGRHDLKPPPMRDVVAYFRTLAPKSLAVSSSATDLNTATQFRRQALSLQPSAPAVSFVEVVPQREGSGLWYCDMHSGSLVAVSHTSDTPKLQTVARFANPAHFTVCDLNGDGMQDIVVADLGSFVPGDHEHGKVWWLAGGADRDHSPVEPQVLLEGIGRVADVRTGDFNADGRLDLVVAEFGWRKSGSIRVLLQEPSSSPAPQFRQLVVDERHGAIHVPVCDLNQDGRLDFVALISQEHEVVEAFLNTGGGGFERRRLFTAGDPSFGSSGIEVVDLDQDGDLDVLATNGDTLDSYYLKPSHGVHWLENRGGFPFEPRKIAPLLGAMRAVSADLDGDNDLDVIATAYLPALLRDLQPEIRHETLIWLEQTHPGEFTRHSLEIGDAGHMSLLATDLDGDGDVDLAVPNYAEQRTTALEPLVIWWNERPQ